MNQQNTTACKSDLATPGLSAEDHRHSLQKLYQENTKNKADIFQTAHDNSPRMLLPRPPLDGAMLEELGAQLADLTVVCR